MNPITSTLELGSQGAQVANLQEALVALLERAAIQPNDPDFRQELLTLLQNEQSHNTYGDVTGKIVGLFQKEQGLEVNTRVDAPTAAALNAQLRELGLLDVGLAPAVRIVSGTVQREGGPPVAHVAVRLFYKSDATAVRLGEDTTDAEGRYTIRYEPLPGVALVTTSLSVEVYAADGRMLGSPAVIQAPEPLEIMDLVVPGVEPAMFKVEGRVASRSSAGLDGLQVRVVDKGVGDDLLLAQTQTAAEGKYSVSFADRAVRDRGKQQPDVQVRVFRDETFLAASEVRYNATPHETLDVRLDEQAVPALPSEHETLTGALRNQFTGALGDLQETEERQDITFLANKTGWDARAVALSALAERCSAGSASPTGEAI